MGGVTDLLNLRHHGASDLGHLVECRDCGLFQRVHTVADGDVAACVRCRRVLRRQHRNHPSLACAILAAMLFVIALGSPLMTMHAAGRFVTGTLFTGPAILDRLGKEEVGALVLITLVAAPAVKLTILLSALFGGAGTHSPRPPRWLAWLFGWFEIVSPWAMVEVFLLGVFVAYTRLRALANVEIGPGLIALGGVMLTMVAADASLDRCAIWESLDPRGVGARRETKQHGRLVGCHVCGLVAQAPEGSPCARCRHGLHHRKRDSVARSWALMLATVALYVPANLLPVMTVMRLEKGGSRTIIGGVVQLFDDHLWPLGIIVLLASIVVPVAKLCALTFMLVTTQRRSRSYLLGRTRLFRVISVIGRWSMIDIFAVTTLVAMVRLGFLASVLPENGVVFFAGVVVITMFATESFDPRLMWDAVQPRGFRAIPSASHTSVATEEPA